MKLQILASSSKANSALVWTDKETILVDAGLSVSKTRRGLASVPPLKGVLVSHLHADHSRNASKIAKAYRVPVYTTVDTMVMCLDIMKYGRSLPSDGIDNCAMVGQTMNVFTIPVPHCCGSVGFVVEEVQSRKRVGIFNDLGRVTDAVLKACEGCSVLCIEANYSPGMLSASERDPDLIRRLTSGFGHLSNDQVSHLLHQTHLPNLHTLCLTHVSEEVNTRELARMASAGAFTAQHLMEKSDGAQRERKPLPLSTVIVAKTDKPTEVIEV